MSGPLRPCQVWVHRGALGDEDAQHDHLTADLHELAGESSHGKLQLPPELRPPPGPAASQHKLEKRGSLKLIDLKFPVGARVDHVHRGKGTVSAVEGGVRYITYDTGEKHRYNPSSLGKGKIVPLLGEAARAVPAAAKNVSAHRVFSLGQFRRSSSTSSVAGARAGEAEAGEAEAGEAETDPFSGHGATGVERSGHGATGVERSGHGATPAAASLDDVDVESITTSPPPSPPSSPSASHGHASFGDSAPTPTNSCGTERWSEIAQSERGGEVSSSFAGMVTKVLAAYGIDAVEEPEAASDATDQLVLAEVCIFLLSGGFFDDPRSVELMERAVAEEKTCVLIVVPGAQFGPGRDSPFPENAFNETWVPHVPSVKPAFKDIAITWESDYPHACQAELLKRVGALLSRRLGHSVIHDVKVAAALNKAEDIALRAAVKMKVSDVELDWDWSTKVFDVFLSHKITDAKDIMLTWYNAFTALGYVPFVDRINLDAVENIPQFIEQACTMIIAITSHLFESYWCAVELCKAVQLHAEGKINILLVPVQGERWRVADPDAKDGVRTISFPTPAVVMANFPKWNIDPDGPTLDRIDRLYSGGDYTRCRLVRHTLMHYKSFERLLIARCGVSIAGQRRLDELTSKGGATIAEQAMTLMPLLAEANALQEGLGSQTYFGLDLTGADSALGYSSAHDDLLVVEEKARVDDELVKTYSPDDFANAVRRLRTQVHNLEGATNSSMVALDVVQTLGLLNGMDLPRDDLDILWDSIEEIGPQLQEVCKILVSYGQITASFLSSLFAVDWPPAFLALADWLSRIVNFRGLFEMLDAIASSVDGMNYPVATLNMMLALACLLIGLSAGVWATYFIKRPGIERRMYLADSATWLATCLLYLAFPIVTQRLLSLYVPYPVGEGGVLLRADKRMDYADVEPYQQGAAFFVVLYIAGIPIFFAWALWYAAAPSRRAHKVSVGGVGGVDAKRLMQNERRNLVRFGLLFSKYEERCWMWELVEISRKLALTGVVVFVAPGTVTQVWFAALTSFFFLLLVTRFLPYESDRVDVVAFVSQTCTMLTLLTVLAKQTKITQEGTAETQRVMESMLNGLLVGLQVLPLAAAVLLVVSALYDVIHTRSASRRRRAKLPKIQRDEPPKGAKKVV